jgi:rare lipoprotein A
MVRGLRSSGIMISAVSRELRSIVMIGLVLIALAGCSSSPAPPGAYKLGKPYQIQGRWYYPQYDPDYDRTGIASWYGEPFHGRATANGEVFDRRIVTAAHPTLPLPSLVRVTNLANRRELVIRVNDRGPFVGDRIIDLSQEAARQLGFERDGTTPVRVQFVDLADARGKPPRPAARNVRMPAPEPAERASPPTRVASRQAPAPSTGAQPPKPEAGADMAQCQGQFIQVGAFAEPARAQRLVAELYALQVVPVSLVTPAQDHLARVRLGPISDPETTGAALDRLKQFGFSEAFVVAPERELSTTC